MNKIKTCIFVVIFILCMSISKVFANVFDNPQNIEYIAKRIPPMQNIKCKFKQEKYMPSSNIKLQSSGDFVFENGKGVIFYTTYPVKTVTRYTAVEYKQINNIISAITNKSYSKLAKNFNFFFSESSNNKIWTLGLKPKSNSEVRNYLTSLEIQGGEYITKMVILTKDLTRTTIWFQK